MEIAAAWVSVRAHDADWRAASRRIHDESRNMQSNFMNTALKLGALVSAFALLKEAANYVWGAGKAFAELDDTIAKVRVVSGAYAQEQINTAEELSRKYGIARKDYLDAASMFTSSLKGVGASQKEATAAGSEIAKLAIDLRSFSGGDIKDAFGALSAAFRGEFDSLEKFGPQLKSSLIETEAIALGFKKVNGELSEAAKRAGVIKLLYKQSSDAVGDLARTQASTNNQLIKLEGTWLRLQEELGRQIDPAFNRFITELNRSIPELESGMSSIGDAITWVVDRFTDAVIIVRNIKDVWEYTVVYWSSGMKNIGEVVGTGFSNFVEIIKWFGRNFFEIIKSSINAVMVLFNNLGENAVILMKEIWDVMSGGEWNPDFKGMLDGFQSTVEAMPELAAPVFEDVGSQLDAIMNRVYENELNRTKKLKEEKKKAFDWDKLNAELKKADELSRKVKVELQITNGGSDLARSVQEAILKANKGDKAQEMGFQKDSLSTQKKIADATTKTAESMQKLADNGIVPRWT